MQTAIIIQHAGEEVLVRLEGVHVPATSIAVDYRHRSWDSWQPVPDGLGVVEVRLEGARRTVRVNRRYIDGGGRVTYELVDVATNKVVATNWFQETGNPEHPRLWWDDLAARNGWTVEAGDTDSGSVDFAAWEAAETGAGLDDPTIDDLDLRDEAALRDAEERQ